MSTISTKISLVQYVGPIFDQQLQGSCVANAYCGDVMLQSNEYHVALAKLSAQFTYNDTRILTGTFPQDIGSNEDFAHASVMTHGMAYESSFTYGGGNELVIPPASVYAQAATQKVLSFTELNANQPYTGIAQTIGQELMQGKGVLVTAFVHQGFGTDLNSINNPMNGVHKYVIVGEDFTAQTYSVLNSWGTTFGNNGIGTIKFTDLPGIDLANQPYGVDLLGLEVINGFAGVDQTWTSQRSDASQLYAAILNRSGEKDGEQYWGGILQAGHSYIEVAKYFYHSSEGLALYGSMTNAQFLNSIYHNIMGRDVDASGLAYWSGLIQNGMDRGEAAANIAYSIAHYTGTDQPTKNESDMLLNKTTVSENYGITFQLDATHTTAAMHSMQAVTSDADSVQLALIGIRHDVGWA